MATIKRYNDAMANATEAVESALRESRLTWRQCEEIYERTRLTEELDAKSRTLELQPWQLKKDHDPRADPARNFLIAGKNFVLALEFSLTEDGSVADAVSRATDLLGTLHLLFSVPDGFLESKIPVNLKEQVEL